MLKQWHSKQLNNYLRLTYLLWFDACISDSHASYQISLNRRKNWYKLNIRCKIINANQFNKWLIKIYGWPSLSNISIGDNTHHIRTWGCTIFYTNQWSFNIRSYLSKNKICFCQWFRRRNSRFYFSVIKILKWNWRTYCCLLR